MVHTKCVIGCQNQATNPKTVQKNSVENFAKLQKMGFKFIDLN